MYLIPANLKNFDLFTFKILQLMHCIAVRDYWLLNNKIFVAALIFYLCACLYFMESTVLCFMFICQPIQQANKTALFVCNLIKTKTFTKLQQDEKRIKGQEAGSANGKNTSLTTMQAATGRQLTSPCKFPPALFPWQNYVIFRIAVGQIHCCQI